MTNQHDGKPRTFWADWWRSARERTGRRLGPAFRAFSANWITLTLPLVLGGLIFGATYVYAQWRAYVAGLFAIFVVLAFALLAAILVFLFYLLMAPAAMWRRDQEIIAKLKSTLTPALRLEFSEEDCMKYLRRGKFQEAMGGKRWYSFSGADQHILIKCMNLSQIRIEAIQAYVVRLELKSRVATLPPPGFFQPVRIMPLAQENVVEDVNLPPGQPCFFSVLVHPSLHDMPRLNGRSQPLEYELLFQKTGVYELGIEAHGRDTVLAAAAIEVELERRDKRDANGQPYQEYEIRGVRQKRMLSGSLA